MTHLIDSDVLIDAIDNRLEARRALRLVRPQNLSVSVVSIGEVLEGLQSARGRREFELLLEPLKIHEVTRQMMVRFASIRADLRRNGNLIADMDIVIAATAIDLDLTLVTRNVKHFRRIPELRFTSPDEMLREHAVP